MLKSLDDRRAELYRYSIYGWLLAKLIVKLPFLIRTYIDIS
jgi:hypothetical protein